MTDFEKVAVRVESGWPRSFPTIGKGCQRDCQRDIGSRWCYKQVDGETKEEEGVGGSWEEAAM